MIAPSLGEAVHYVAPGPGAGDPPVCRVAAVTEINRADPRQVGLAVTNPTELVFHPLADGGLRYDHGSGYTDSGDTCFARHEPGTWHFPARL